MKTFLFLILTSVPLVAAKVLPEMVLQPNIVLIMADDVGCEPIGAYGGERWETPNIDALAKDGMRFDYCFSMPVCGFTRSTYALVAHEGIPRQNEQHVQ